MEVCTSTDVSQEVKDCLFLLSGYISLQSDTEPKAPQNSLSGMGHPSVARYPGSTTSTPPWDMADSHQKEGQQVKGRRILSPLLWKLLEYRKMSGLPWIFKPIIHLAQNTWYMLSRNVMKEKGRKKGKGRRKDEGGNEATMSSKGERQIHYILQGW